VLSCVFFFLYFLRTHGICVSSGVPGSFGSLQRWLYRRDTEQKAQRNPAAASGVSRAERGHSLGTDAAVGTAPGAGRGAARAAFPETVRVRRPTACCCPAPPTAVGSHLEMESATGSARRAPEALLGRVRRPRAAAAALRPPPARSRLRFRCCGTWASARRGRGTEALFGRGRRGLSRGDTPGTRAEWSLGEGQGLAFLPGFSAATPKQSTPRPLLFPGGQRRSLAVGRERWRGRRGAARLVLPRRPRDGRTAPQRKAVEPSAERHEAVPRRGGKGGNFCPLSPPRVAQLRSDPRAALNGPSSPQLPAADA